MDDLQIRVTIKDLASAVIKALTKELAKAKTAQDSLSASTKSATASFTDLRTVLLSVALSYVGITKLRDATRDLVTTVADVQQINTRIRSLVNSNEQYEKSWDYLYKTAKNFNAEILILADSYSKLLVLQQAGILTTQNSRDILEGFANITARTGASALQLKQSLFGLSQGLTAGTLRAEELNQITEPLPGLLQELDRAAGVAAGGFRKLVLEGKVTSDMLRDTLLIALKEYDGSAQAMSNNLIPTYTRMANAYTELKISLEQPVSTFLVPLMNAIEENVRSAIVYIKQNKEELVQNSQSLLNYTLALGNAAGATINFIANNKELIVVLISFYTTLKIVRSVLAAIAVMQLASFFATLNVKILALTVSLKTLTLTSIAAWLTGGATGAVALTMALTNLSIVVAAGFAIYQIVRLTTALYDLYQARQLLHDAEKDGADLADRLATKLQRISKEVGVNISSIDEFNQLVKEGAIIPDEQSGKWVKVKDVIIDFVEEVDRLEGTIGQKMSSLGQQRMRLTSLEEKFYKGALKDMLGGRLAMNIEVLQNARLTANELIQLELQTQRKINNLQKKFTNEKLSTEDKIRALYRREMSQQGAQVDLQNQITEKIAEAQRLLKEGNTNEATELANQVKQLAEGLTNTENAVNAFKTASTVIKASIQQQIDDTKTFQAELKKQSNSQFQIRADISQAEQEIERLKSQLASLKDKQINITAKHTTGYNLGGEVFSYARGGIIPGIGDTDTVPALLTPGEFVVRKARSQKFNGLLHALNFWSDSEINKSLKPIGFNSGGPVFPSLPMLQSPSPVSTYQKNETIRLEWVMGDRKGSLETLMSQRQNLRELVSAIDKNMKGL